MERSLEALIGMAGVAFVALAVFALYRRQQRQRVRRVESRVKDYLVVRYGELPNDLSINCSDDALWPVLVSFDDAHTGRRHRLQFGCWGPVSTLSLLSEKEDERWNGPSAGAPAAILPLTPAALTAVPARAPGAAVESFPDQAARDRQ
jgi:hypothetical protein